MINLVFYTYGHCFARRRLIVFVRISYSADFWKDLMETIHELTLLFLIYKVPPYNDPCLHISDQPTFLDWVFSMKTELILWWQDIAYPKQPISVLRRSQNARLWLTHRSRAKDWEDRSDRSILMDHQRNSISIDLSDLTKGTPKSLWSL